MTTKYRKQPIVIEAIQWTGENIREICNFMQKDGVANINLERGLAIETLEGKLDASIGDYIIKGIKGEFYPCKPEIFESSYSIVDEQSEIKRQQMAHERLMALRTTIERIHMLTRENSTLREKLAIHEHYMGVTKRLDRSGHELMGMSDNWQLKELEVMAYEIESSLNHQAERSCEEVKSC